MARRFAVTTPSNVMHAPVRDGFTGSGWVVIAAVTADRLTVRHQQPWASQEPFTVSVGHVAVWDTMTFGPEPLCPGMAIQADGVWTSPGVIDATTIVIGSPHPACPSS